MFNECSFPWHKLLTRLTQQNCFVVYRLNFIHEFTSFFSTKVIFAGMPKKTFPRKQAFVDRKQGPRFSQGQPKGYWAIIKWKNLIEQLKHLLEWMLYERWRRLSIQSSTCQHVWILQFVSSAETDSAYSKRADSKLIYPVLPHMGILHKYVWYSHLCFSVVGQATPKIRPRPAKRLFWNKGVWTTAKSC